ncbi:LacI family DNA-binding transcriptional regulator [Salipiger marinus]|uniref:LacI family DNA-binding transcriptional regulator n=1 Tax=Salipiger marinus TaxID=555512 RepID=UPI002B731571|nr:substrate-binding domain-containing protein [Salipiger manganoxidans]MEB3418503.1 substrate-binding domain-containing protein [Salipiger manganoxidans]
MPKRTTLRDIAQELQLSVSSVSLALRGHPRIPENTTEKVRQTAARLGYIYNRAAADLRRAESRLVAVCINDLSNPVFNEFLVQIEEELHSQDRAVFLGVARESAELQRQFLKTALEHGVSGIILCPVQGTGVADLDMLLPAGDGTAPVVPTAVFSRRIAAASLTQFVNDDPLTGRLAAGCVLDEGHRRIGWLGGGQATSTAQGRLAGCLARLNEAGLPPPQIRHGPTSRAFGRSAALELLRGPEPPTALLCFSDLIAFGALATLRELGLRPGIDVSLVGCDDMDEAAFTAPGLTTVMVDKAGIGRSAARSLLEPPRPGVTVLAPRLIRRATVGPAPRA